VAYFFLSLFHFFFFFTNFIIHLSKQSVYSVYEYNSIGVVVVKEKMKSFFLRTFSVRVAFEARNIRSIIIVMKSTRVRERRTCSYGTTVLKTAIAASFCGRC
jgi:hypothetical protein